MRHMQFFLKYKMKLCLLICQWLLLAYVSLTTTVRGKKYCVTILQFIIAKKYIFFAYIYKASKLNLKIWSSCNSNILKTYTANRHLPPPPILLWMLNLESWCLLTRSKLKETKKQHNHKNRTRTQQILI